MTDELRSGIMEQNKVMADKALRVMASARRDWGASGPESYDPSYLEHDLSSEKRSGWAGRSGNRGKPDIADRWSGGGCRE